MEKLNQKWISNLLGEKLIKKKNGKKLNLIFKKFLIIKLEKKKTLQAFTFRFSVLIKKKKKRSNFLFVDNIKGKNDFTFKLSNIKN